ncbi:MAG: hypothetical protein PHQ28_07660, partial [Mycobacterium sp.]|nr:hypothetical protein [Mycobacterium sp.]
MKTRRPTQPTRSHRSGSGAEWTPTEADHVEATATNPDIYALADTLPKRPDGDCGRPSRYPTAVYVIYVALAGVLGSHRKAACAMRNRHYWRIIGKAASEAGALDLPQTPPTRNQCEYHRGKIAEHVEVFAARYRELAYTQAVEHGCFDQGAPRSATDLRRANFVAADGKVVKSPILRKTAERWREQGRRIDATMHVQGGEAEQDVFGAKFWLATARPGTDRNDRIVIDMRRVPKSGYGGEAGIAVDGLLELADRAPGMRGVCYDGALRGTHIDRLLKRGLVVLSPTHGATKPTALKRIACGCGDRHHELWTLDGRICERQILDTGETDYQPCPVAKLYPRANADGTYRWYADFAVQSCGTIHTERVDNTAQDAKRGYNRAEHIRLHVKTDDQTG